METAQGKIHKIYVAPGPCASLHSNAAAGAVVRLRPCLLPHNGCKEFACEQRLQLDALVLCLHYAFSTAGRVSMKQMLAWLL